MEKGGGRSGSGGCLTLVVSALLAYILLFTGIAGYLIYQLQVEVNVLKEQVHSLQGQSDGRFGGDEAARLDEKREVISGGAGDAPDWIKGLVARPGAPGAAGPQGSTGSQGPAGPQGPPGKDGRHGRDAFSLPAVEKLINVSVSKAVTVEHQRLVSSLPTYGGAVYTRWGRTVCPKQSEFIYKGQMTGPDFRSEGGGVNFVCLPDDPDIETDAAKLSGSHSDLRPVFVSPYEISSVLAKSQHLPCVVCEAPPRISQLTIPAKSRCPSGWEKEYEGYMLSAPSQHITDGRYVDNHSRTDYVCLDNAPESRGKSTMQKSLDATYYGLPLYSVTANCEGTGTMNNCPPYQQNAPLKCVLCTK